MFIETLCLFKHINTLEYSKGMSSTSPVVNQSGFTSFEDARQALIFRYYHPQADFQTRIPEPRDNAGLYDQNLSIDANGPCTANSDSYTSTIARKAATFPRMDTMTDFAREYILLLAQWNQQTLFTEDAIREFVYYIEARKSQYVVPTWSAQIYDANVTNLSQSPSTELQPWFRGNEPFIRELTKIIFNPLKNRT